MSAVGWELVSGGDSLSLTNDGTGSEFWFETLADGWDLGSPAAVKAVFASLAADGDDERITRHGNRTVPFSVKVCGADLLSVSAGERALRLMLNRAPNLELRYTPPDGFGEVTVFDVLLGEMANTPDDLALVKSQPWATYAVTLTCKPFVRPVEPVTVSLTYGSDAGTSLDAGTSTTGWSSPDGTLSAVTVSSETAIKLVPTSAGGNRPFTFNRTALSLTAAKPYLAVDVAAPQGSGVGVSSIETVYAYLGSTFLGAPVAVVPQASGFVRFFFSHGLAGTSQTVKIVVRSTASSFSEVYVGNVLAYSTVVGSGLVVADVEGSERAPMTVNLTKVSAGDLGGGVFISSDPTYLTHGWNPNDSATWPNAPAGSYIAVAPISSSDTHLYTLTINGQASSTRGGAGTALFWEYSLGARRDGRLGTITTGWSDAYTGSGSGISQPSFMLFRNEPGVTSLLYLSSVPWRCLFVDSPTLEENRLGVWGGDQPDGSDAVSLLSVAESPDSLLVKPPRFALFVKAVATDIQTTLTYYPLSHTFVPPKGLTS